ncbi:GHKL domain-containing protein [Candidatus Enterococcus ferrettii]|uniref:Two-component system, LytTR family, sensor histidine kinase AgrC n=1 Tax=Candidatus Enterococcus ferrettii TaxID=2815324 RepID=A0ABV0EUF1_9ENTE|nr:GHKL domain-containing protein [Enterococcus sp. 665A]MBO1339456.1 GHKL domain-containing protein [Enterococcus sp. 665A]
MSPNNSMAIYTLNYLVILWTIIDRTFISRKSTYLVTLFLFVTFLVAFLTDDLYTVINFYFLYLIEFLMMRYYLSNWLAPAMVLFLQYALTSFIRLITYYMPSFYVPTITMTTPVELTTMAVFQCLLLLIAAYLLKRADKKYGVLSSLREMPHTYLFPGLCIFTLFLILVTLHTYLYLYDRFYITLLLLMLLFSITLLIITYYTFKNKNYQQNSYLKALRLSMNEEKQNYELAREYRHDFRGILLGLKEYINAEDFIGAKEFLDQTIQDSDNYLQEYRFVQLASIKNAAIRGLLSDFVKRCDSREVYLELKIKDQGNPSPISQIDLVRSVSIVLNNAFEACLLEQDQYVYITLENTSAQWQLEVKNPSTTPISNTADLMMKNYSTKQNHNGLGLYNLKKITNKYANFFSMIHLEPDQFTIRLNIFK